MASPNPPAGGRATEAGMSFEAGVGAWFAAHIICYQPIGSRFGLADDAIPIELRFETGIYLDDVSVRLSDGSNIHVQCKTHPNLSDNVRSGLASTIAQFVPLYLDSRTTSSHKSVAILAVAADAARSLDELERACRAFDYGDTWEEVQKSVSGAQRDALKIFESCVRSNWDEGRMGALAAADLASMAKLFRVVRFDMESGQRDWSECAQLVGRQLFGAADAGDRPLRDLLGVTRKLVRSGAGATAAGLLDSLRDHGWDDSRSPRFNADVDRLRAHSAAEIARLSRHTRLPIAGGLPIVRDCIVPLRDSVKDGSLLVVGEPGSGKTGVLVNLAEEYVSQGVAFAFLSVDRFGGVGTADALRRELQLDNPLLDVLAGWPGRGPGVLLVDALDASRGGPAEGVFASLIEDAVARLGQRWSIVASIRTFDLRNGRRFRAAMAGTPPSPEHADASFTDVRHFQVPRLSLGELSAIGSKSAELEKLLRVAELALQELLKNIFNLSLAAELLSSGVSAESINSVTTQSELIDRYEDQRLPTGRMQTGVSGAVETMVRRRRLAIPRVAVTNDAIDEVLLSGVLVQAGDRISFAHHVLFDHAAGRFFLDWDDPMRLKEQMVGDPAIGLMLGPAFRFAMERVWRDDAEGRPITWNLISSLVSADKLDPIIASVALRTAAERVVQPQDVGRLCEMLVHADMPETLGPVLSRLARFVSLNVVEAGTLTSSAAVAWSRVANTAMETPERRYADGARFLLMTGFEKGDFSNADFSASFGRGARALLKFAWNTSPPMPNLAASAIRFVCRSFGSDVSASRELLQRILEEPRFSAFAHEEAQWLAEGIGWIFPFDANFAVQVYASLFGKPAPQQGKTWLGGMPSRIMPMTSNGKQDYEHARWHLRRALPSFLKSKPIEATEAVSAAAIGMVAERYGERTASGLKVGAPSSPVEIVDDRLSLQEWRSERRRNADPDGDFLAAFAQYLKVCSPEDFRAVVASATNHVAASSVWARIFGNAAERKGIVDDKIWPIAANLEIMGLPGLLRDAINYLAGAFPTRSVEEREALETALLARIRSDEEDARRYRSLAARFLSVVSERELVSPGIKNLRRELVEEGALSGNRPLVSIEIGSGPAEGFVDRHLAARGIGVDKGPDHEVRAAGRAIEELLEADKSEGVEKTNAIDLWVALQHAIKVIDAYVRPTPHEETLRTTWAAISNALEIVAKARKRAAKTHQLPQLGEILSVADRLLLSEYPQQQERSRSDSLGWGNWDVRVYGASSVVALADDEDAIALGLVERLEKILLDPVPAVRLQAAQSLNVLWNVARDHMWRLMEFVSLQEQDPGVLGFFVGGPLVRISQVEPERCEALVKPIINRLTSLGDSEELRGQVCEAIGHLSVRLWVGQNRSEARDWIRGWATNFVRDQNYLWHTTSALRSALFARFEEGASPKNGALQDRAREALGAVIDAASIALRESTGALSQDQITEEQRERAEARYRAGERLLDHACNQLYFGAGVFRGSGNEEARGLNRPETMRQFLVEYGPLLEKISEVGTAQTIHHLVELYEYLIVAAPEEVFGRATKLMLDAGVREGYQFESLASNVLVRVVRRYLADYRSIFEDTERRARLVQVLELFSSAGWPEALKLLYDLPDLLR